MQDFQAFTLRYSARTNVLFGKVGISQAFDLNSEPSNHKPIRDIQAIWDTGATCTVISKKLANELGLVPTGKETVTGIDHDSLENTFFVNIFLPNKVCMVNLKIIEVPAIKNADLLIGMDIIGSGDFSVYTENNVTVMTYRYPSIGGVDFVVEAGNIRKHKDIFQKIEEQKVNRRPLSNKKKEKRRKERKNKKRHNKKRK